MSNDFDPNKLLEKLGQATFNHQRQYFDMNSPEEYRVKLRGDNSLKPGLFYPDPLIPGGYKAHPITIAAVRKDILVGGFDGFEDLEVPHTCEGCKTALDLQFWHFCPYCEHPFPTELSK